DVGGFFRIAEVAADVVQVEQEFAFLRLRGDDSFLRAHAGYDVVAFVERVNHHVFNDVPLLPAGVDHVAGEILDVRAFLDQRHGPFRPEPYEQRFELESAPRGEVGVDVQT